MTPQERATIAAMFYEKWQNDSSLETWFPITAEELKQLRAELATAKAQIEKLGEYAEHVPTCSMTDPCTNKPCTCGLSKLLEEIRP